MKLTRNFSIQEFACKDGTPVPGEYILNVTEVARNLQALRDTLNRPVHINSAYRTAFHNTKVGGSPNSQHLLAKAADIHVAGLTPNEVYHTIEKLIEQGKMKQGGLGLYKSFCHYDVRGTKARW